MNRTWLAFTLAAIAIVGMTAYAVIRSRTPDLGPAGPNRDLAPDTIAVYAEFPDVAGTWRTMEKTEAWQDLATSKLAERFLAVEEVKSFLEALDQVSAKAAYPLNARNAMKFVGRECSVGIALDPAGGAPRVLVLTKLDVEALSNDFLGGKVNLEALWGEMQRRTGKCDFTVAATDYKGNRVATATRDATSFHAALVGDTLAVSTDAALVRAAIDCHLAGGAGSLGHKAAFVADVKALPAGTAGFEWYDLDALDAGKSSLDAGLASLGATAPAVAAVHGILDGTRGAHSVALSTVLPEGDLYRATWAFSKSAELFADRASPPLRDFFAGDWLVYGEVRELGAVAEAYERSALKKKLGAGEIGKWFDGAMNDPGPMLGKALAEMTGGGRGAGPPGAAGLDDDLALVDQFAVRMGRHVLSEQAKALVDGELAAGLDWTGREGERPRFAWTIRLDVEGRLFALAAQAAAMQAGQGVSYEQVGARRVFSVDAPGTKIWWVCAGDAFLLTNDHDLALTGARTGSAPAAARSKRVDDSMLAMKAGWRAFVHLDYARAMSAVGAAAESQPEMGQVHRMLDTYREMGVMGEDVAVAAYVPDDFGSIEVRGRMRLAEPRTAEAKALLAAGEDREPLVWASLPETTFVNLVNYPANIPSMWLLTKTLLVPGSEVEQKFRETMGMDLEKELIPALGREFSLSATFRAAPIVKAGGPGGGAPLVPGILLGLEVRDAAVVRKAVDRGLEIAEEGLKEDPGYASTKPFVREAHDGVEVVRMVIPETQADSVPVRPALALHDGYLLISSDSDVLLAAIDAKNGKGRRFADSPVFGRATAVLGKKCGTFEVVDWSRLADQVAEYAPQMGGLFAASDVKFPDYPDDGNQDEWKRRLDEYQKKQNEARASGGGRAKSWIDSFRVIDFAGVSTHMTGNVAESTLFVKFAE